jgi:hypothetical protein
MVPMTATGEKKPPELAIKDSGPITLEPALQQIGTTDCPVCKHEVAVFLTRNKRPFVNCSFCSTRIFYNGQESMRLLKKKMTVIATE